jgi:antitoxin FitA
MATLTIRNLDQLVKERLRVRAAEHGLSMEAEARRILQTALGRVSAFAGTQSL